MNTAEYFENLAERQKKNFVKIPFDLSLIGLMLSVIYGVGAVFSIIALVMAVRRSKVKKSTSLRWAKVVSVVTLFLCLLFWIGLIAVCIAFGEVPAEV